MGLTILKAHQMRAHEWNVIFLDVQDVSTVIEFRIMLLAFPFPQRSSGEAVSSWKGRRSCREPLERAKKPS